MNPSIQPGARQSGCTPKIRTMILETFPVGPLQCNCTLLGDEAAGEAIVIDPGDEIHRIQKRLKSLASSSTDSCYPCPYRPRRRSPETQAANGRPYFSERERSSPPPMMDDQAAWIGVPTPEVGLPDEGLIDGQSIGIGGYPAEVIHTPGHTQGSVCLYFAPLEDGRRRRYALFRKHRPHRSFLGGNFEQIIESIHASLLNCRTKQR